MKSSRLLAVVIVLQIVALLSQMLGGNGYVTPAYGQIPDAGAQRDQLIQEMKTANAKLDRLAAILESGNLQVKVVKPDDK